MTSPSPSGTLQVEAKAALASTAARAGFGLTPTAKPDSTISANTVSSYLFTTSPSTEDDVHRAIFSGALRTSQRLTHLTKQMSGWSVTYRVLTIPEMFDLTSLLWLWLLSFLLLFKSISVFTIAKLCVMIVFLSFCKRNFLGLSKYSLCLRIFFWIIYSFVSLFMR